MKERERNTILQEAAERIREKLLEQIRETGISERELSEKIDEAIIEECAQGLLGSLGVPARMQLHRSIFNAFRRLGILQELIDDRSVSEIMINGPEEIFVERNRRVERWNRRFESSEQLETVIQQVVGSVNRIVNTSTPIADARLADGSRVHVVLPPVSLCGPVMTIRKFPEPITIEKLIAGGSLTEEAAEYLRTLVICGYNFFISGGTNSGKTTFLNALSAFIPPTERVITIEDSAELQLRHLPNLVRLETRNANTEGEGAVGMSELIRASLRMNPDRIVVGEVRGAEAMDMLQACNTGHDGSLSTGHANSARDMLSRLETMALSKTVLPLPALRSQIASAIDILVHLGRLPDRSRKVLEITEIRGYENEHYALNRLFVYDAQEKRLKKTGALFRKEKLLRAGGTLSGED